jgi:signal transduction histidine kinase
VAEALEVVVRDLQGSAARAGVALRVDAGPTMEVVTDLANLQMALGELIANALQVSPAGTTVMLSWEDASAGRIRINVDDEGPGVAAENAEKIMRPFFSTQPQARGLGLVLVARLCSLAGGTLEWQNLPRGGCRFSLLMPAGSRPQPSAGVHGVPP